MCLRIGVLYRRDYLDMSSSVKNAPEYAKKWAFYKITGKVTILSITPCLSLEDVLNGSLEIGSFCMQTATKTFDFVVFFGDETFRNQQRR